MFKFILLLFIIVNAQAESIYNCTTEHIIYESRQYSPPDNLKNFKIKISKDKNKLTLITQNMQSIYEYKHFIRPSKIITSIGVSYEGNGKFVDVFNNNVVFVGTVGEAYSVRAKCPSMNLNIRPLAKVGTPFAHTLV